MKKFITTLMASMLLLSSTTYATEKFGKLNKADTQILFGKSNVEALALGQDEMDKTEGEFLQFLIPVIVGIGAGYIYSQQDDEPLHNTPGYRFRYDFGNSYEGRNFGVKKDLGYIKTGQVRVRPNPAR